MQWPSVNSPAGNPPTLSPEEAIDAWEDACLWLTTMLPDEWPNRAGIYCPIHHQYEWHDTYELRLIDLLSAWGTSLVVSHVFQCIKDFPVYGYYSITYRSGQWVLLYSSFNTQSTIQTRTVTWPILSVQKP
jgi:hypothetical protein